MGASLRTHVGGAIAAERLGDGALEAKEVAVGVGFGGCRLVEHAAEVDEVLLSGGTLLERRGLPFAYEVLGRHAAMERVRKSIVRDSGEEASRATGRDFD